MRFRAFLEIIYFILRERERNALPFHARLRHEHWVLMAQSLGEE